MRALGTNQGAVSSLHTLLGHHPAPKEGAQLLGTGGSWVGPAGGVSGGGGWDVAENSQPLKEGMSELESP